MTDLTRLPLRGQQEGSFHVVVESPRGSTVKLRRVERKKMMEQYALPEK